MNREEKAALVEEMSSALNDADAIFAVDYRGISVPQAAELRARLAEADATFRIVKNRLARLAAESAGTEGLEGLFEGPTALTLVKGDPVSAAKAIATFRREHRLLEFKGGLMEGAPLDPEEFMTIARLPALDVLHGQLVGVAASPITGLARGLASMLSGLAVALGEIQDKGLVSGEATPGPEADTSPAEPDAGASEEQDQSGESERAEAEDSAGNDEDTSPAEPDAGASEGEAEAEADPAGPGREAEEAAGSGSDVEGETNPAEPDAGASEEQRQSGESERAEAEDSAGNDQEE